MGKFEKNTPKNAPRTPRPKRSETAGKFATSKNKKGKKNPWPLYLGIAAAAILLCVCGYFFVTAFMGGMDDIKDKIELEQNHIAKNVHVVGVDIGGLTRNEAMDKLRNEFEVTKAQQSSSDDSAKEYFTFGDKMQNMEINFYGSDPVLSLFTTKYDPEKDIPVEVDIFGDPIDPSDKQKPTEEVTEEVTDETAQAPTEEATEEPDPDAPADKVKERTLHLSASDMVVTFDLQAVIEEAYQYGRATAAKEDGTERIDIDISKHMTFDNESYLDEVLTHLAEELGEGNATEVKHKADCLEIKLGGIGRSFDMDELKDAIKRTYMIGEFEMIYEYDEVLPEPLDLDQLYKDYKCTEPVNAVYDKETYELSESKDGYGFTMGEAYALLSTAKSGDTVILPLTTIEPKYTTEFLKEKLFGDVLATYDSPHVWNPVRTHNLELAAEAIDGTILLPGDIFSFNDIVGERTADKGYGAAAVYVGGKTEDQLGGGVCQVASTIYWCTLKADLEVIERYEHQFTPSYVPWGMDATIYWGSLDYQFRNNTEFPIRIDASVSDGYVHITLVGTETKDYSVNLFYEIVSSNYSETKYIYIHPDMDDYSEYSGYDDGETIQTAYDGYVVNTYLQKLDENGDVISTDRVNISEYDRRDKEIAVLLDPSIPMDWQIDENGNLIEGDDDDDEEESSTEPSEEPTESTEPTEPTEPSESTEPTEPSESTEPTEPSESTEPTEPPTTEATEPTEPPTEAPTDPPENSGPGTITPGT